MTDRLGFCVEPDVFRRADLLGVAAALRACETNRRRGGMRGMLSVSEVRELAEDERLLALARTSVGLNPRPFRATLFDKSPRANWLVAWHQDTVLPLRARVDAAEWGPWTAKGGVLHAGAPAAALERIVAIRVYLDDSTSANGPLRVLPRTHTSGVLTHQQIGRLAGEIGAVECLAPAGGVVIMRPLVVHASSKARDDSARRVLHIEHAATLDAGGGVALAVA